MVTVSYHEHHKFLTDGNQINFVKLTKSRTPDVVTS